MLSNGRIAIIIFFFASTFLLLHLPQTIDEIPIKKSLDHFPKQIGKWNHVNSRFLSDQIAEMIGVDDYIDYDFSSPDKQIISLYVSYFKALGITGGYHSPKNCLPGSGWNITGAEQIELVPSPSATAFGPVKVNLMVVNNGSDKQVVLYWYQNCGRVIASEYWAKIYMVFDSIVKRRRDGSFIRVMAPFRDGELSEKTDYLKEFASQVLFKLQEFLPGNQITS